MSIRKVCAGGIILAAIIATPFITIEEGQKTVAYRDIVGILTICSGETKGVYEGQKLSTEQCEKMTYARVLEFAAAVDAMVHVPMSVNTHAAITSWAYNVGVSAARRSTLIKKLNAGNYVGACHELKRWNRAGGHVVRGLINRRKRETKLCLKDLKR